MVKPGNDSDEGGNGRVSRKVRRRRRWLRIFVWCTAMLLLCAVVVTVVAVMLFENRTAVVNYVLRETVQPFGVTIDAVEFPHNGVVEIDGLRIDGEPGGDPAVVVPKLTVGYSEIEGERFRYRLKSIKAERPVVRIDDAVMTKVMGIIDAAKNKKGDPGAAPLAFSKMVIGEIAIEGAEIELASSRLPPARFTLDTAVTTLDLRGREGAETNEPVRLSLRDLSLGPVDDPLPVEWPELDVTLRPDPGFRSGSIDPINVEGIELTVTPELLARVAELMPKREGPEPAEDGALVKPPGTTWRLAEFDLRDSRLTLEGFDGITGGPTLPDVSFDVDATGRDWQVGGGGVSSDGLQTLELTGVEVRADAPDGAEEGSPAARIDRVGIGVIPGNLLKSGVIESVRVEGPAFEISRESMARYLESQPPSGRAEAEDEPGDSKSNAATRAAMPFVVRELIVENGTFKFDPEGFNRPLPTASGKFAVATRETENDGDSAYRVSIQDVRLRNPNRLIEDMIHAETVEIDFSALGLQKEKYLESIRLNGIHLTVDDALLNLIPQSGATAGATEDAEENQKSRWENWRLGKFDIQESTVTVAEILDDFPTVRFGVQTLASLEDLSLADADDAAVNIEKRVELVNLEITSPLNPSVTVAHLPSIFVEFSLDGLLHRTIGKVEMVNPDLFVGEHLFWFVDYQRKRDAKAAADETAETADAPDAGAWTVKRVQAHNGRMIFAPKGYPIGFNPFPFAMDTNLEEGEISLQLTIPSGTYAFEEYKLELEGLSGEAAFNYPLKDDNNLVQTFSAKKFRYKQYEADDVWLTVTYDAGGFYSRFGGEAYTGYVEGGVNVYVDDKYRWDASLSGTDIELAPFTRVASKSLRLEGSLNGTFVAGGVGKEVGLADGQLTMMRAGHMEIPRLVELVDRFPDDWSQLKTSIANIGIEQLKDFSFDSGSGSFGFIDPRAPTPSLDGHNVPVFGLRRTLETREPNGVARLSLKGPTGLRSMTVNYHHERDDAEASLKKSVSTASNP